MLDLVGRWGVMVSSGCGVMGERVSSVCGEDIDIGGVMLSSVWAEDMMGGVMLSSVCAVTTRVVASEVIAVVSVSGCVLAVVPSSSLVLSPSPYPVGDVGETVVGVEALQFGEHVGAGVGVGVGVTPRGAKAGAWRGSVRFFSCAQCSVGSQLTELWAGSNTQREC